MLDKYNLLLRKQEDYLHENNMKFQEKKNKIDQHQLRNQFIEKVIKPVIENISTRENDQRRKSFIETILELPPIDLRDESVLKNAIYFDDKMEMVQNIFPNGNQLQEIYTVGVILLMWILLTNSAPLAILLTYLVDEYVFNSFIAYKCRDNLQKMTKVRSGFMI